MAGLSKRLHIAVVGERASGKSYLLYDLIHAFGLLGYQPEQLPLRFPHSSFGTYFYDTFNSKTGGMRGTERYACRPDNHYGAWLSNGRMGRRIEVDFLNIPGEVFDLGEKRMSMFFHLRQLIERSGKGLFYLSVWRNPAGREIRLIVNRELNLAAGTAIRPSSQLRFGTYLNWDHLRSDIARGRYKEVKRRPVSGHYLLSHLTELQTDSVLLTIEHCWRELTSFENLSLDDYRAHQVLFYFYPLVYCQHATDLVICDNLMQGSNVGDLAEHVALFMKEGRHRRPHVFLAFRGADQVLGHCSAQTTSLLRQDEMGDASSRNTLYEAMMGEVDCQMSRGADSTQQPLPDGWDMHIRQSLGDGVGQAFWHLLNASAQHGRLDMLLPWRDKPTDLYALSQRNGWKWPPHVYLTATPVDAAGRIYVNDPSDVTRFCCDDGAGLRSFTAEVNSGRRCHLCLGSYQLLTDILLQNGIRTAGLQQRGEHLCIMQSKL